MQSCLPMRSWIFALIVFGSFGGIVVNRVFSQRPFESSKDSSSQNSSLSSASTQGAASTQGTSSQGASSDERSSRLTFTDSVASALKTYCLKCHGADQGNIEGEVDLLAIDRGNLNEQLELIRNVIEVLDLEEMPPADESQPEPELRAKLVSDMKEVLRASVSKKKVYLPTPIRRMNRFQYNNAVIDLFDLKCIVFTLPERMMREHKEYFKPGSGEMPDVVTVGSRPLGKSQMIERRLAGVAAFPQDLRAEHGYDNRGDHLSLSPLLMESFLNLGQSVTESPDFVPRNVGIWKSFFAAPPAGVDPVEEARGRLTPFLRRAFRRPPDQDLLDRYADYVARQLDVGVEFPEAMKSVAAAAISSPRFLYLYDRSGFDEGAQPIDNFELASRLSFFLWGSLPDETLLDLAVAGELMDGAVLEAQVDRMLKDHKLKRFCDSFPSQWLQLERIISAVPNPDKYPDFYYLKYRDSMHMMLEPLLLFETVLIEDLPITQFIDSDFTYRSTLLENAYGELASTKERAKRGEEKLAHCGLKECR